MCPERSGQCWCRTWKAQPQREAQPSVGEQPCSRSAAHSEFLEHPTSNQPEFRSSEKKGSARAVLVAAGKKPSSIKKESPTCNLFSASKIPGRSPLANQLFHLGRKPGPAHRQQQARQSLSDQLHRPQLAVPSVHPRYREQPPSVLVTHSLSHPQACHPNATHWVGYTTWQRCASSRSSLISERASKCHRAQSSCFPANKSSNLQCCSGQDAAPQESCSPWTYYIR